MNRILVNEKTIIGEKDTRKYVEKMPNFNKSFEAKYVSTDGHEIFRDFSL